MDFSIERALKNSHDRINRILNGLVAAARAGRWEHELMDRAFRSVNLQMKRHLQFEEEAFFPALRRSNGSLPPGRMEMLVRDHQWIRDALTAADSSFKAGNRDAARSVLEGLQVFLHGHERDEEEVYAGLELTKAEREGVREYVRREQAAAATAR